MAVWAIGDLHLSFGVPNKSMDIFGPQWEGHDEKIKKAWLSLVKADDLVLLPGDISWAMRIEDVCADLEWIHQLPGTKVMIRGNHDYWWASLKKIEQILPSSIHIIQNNVWRWNGIGIGGVRLWDTPEYGFNPYIEYRENPREKNGKQEVYNPQETERIFVRELARLEMSLKCFNASDQIRIAMIHYPPIGADLADSRVSAILEKYHVDLCVFGHLHNVRQGALPFGVKNGVRYILTSSDYLDFNPIKVL